MFAVAGSLNSSYRHPHCVFKVSYLYCLPVSPKAGISGYLWSVLGRLVQAVLRRVPWIMWDRVEALESGVVVFPRRNSWVFKVSFHSH